MKGILKALMKNRFNFKSFVWKRQLKLYSPAEIEKCDTADHQKI
jgi:primosomal replication protein N